MQLRQTIASWFSPSSTTPLQSPGNAYGLSPSSFIDLLATEYPALHTSELVHLDHAASPPPPTSAIAALTLTLSTNLYLNPHSHAPTRQEIDVMRSRIMEVLFCLKQQDQANWDLVWTSGASASLKIVAEHFSWSPRRAKYRYLKESHTSLVGIRACALAGGAEVESLDLDAFLSPLCSEDDPTNFVLHAYPAQCNVTGSRLGLHPTVALSRILERRRGQHAVLVDAAAYLSTSPLDLSTVSYEDAPDFIVGSFYKIYGHPTGLGFLLIKRSTAHLLTSSKDTYFGGGAIEALSVSSPYWVHPRGSKDTTASLGVVHERFENGTISYLSIVALGCAIDAHQKLFNPCISSTHLDSCSSLRAVGKHTHHLADLARNSMTSLRHWDGSPLVRIYKGEGSGRWEDDGPAIAFTLYTPPTSRKGSPRPIGHTHLLNLATLANIQLRTGGLCNTGVLARVSGLDDREFKELWEEGRVCGDAVEFGGNAQDKLLGLARISFGACSSVQDVERFIDFLKRYFLISQEVVRLFDSPPINSIEDMDKTDVYVESLVRYPIKSCAGQLLVSAHFTSHGLLHDREFAIVNSATGKIMSQKQFPRMVLIHPSINDNALEKMMTVRATGMPDLTIPLRYCQPEADVRTYSSLVGAHRMSTEADEWVSKFLGVPCQLHRTTTPNVLSASSCATSIQPTLDTSTSKPPIPIIFSNESPFTLISSFSVAAINDWIASSHLDSQPAPIDPSCFRANFLLSSHSALPPFHEDSLAHVRIGTQTFQVLARCRRCLMICVDGKTGVRMREPFCCLAKHRRNGKQRVEFGVHLMWRPELSGSHGERKQEEFVIKVGDRVGWTFAVSAGCGGG
ncbi:hypothetical protein H0H87_000809 [Tephrocybe sp. NHM501043]|nr:hypothetical protein H0H87_000809 [Tephrocybe sp. NHM501043]